jgi:hypothetical protein
MIAKLRTSRRTFTRLAGQLGALLQVDRRSRFAQALQVGLLTPRAGVAAARAAGRRAEPFEQVAERFSAAFALQEAEQFDRVDAELQEEVVERLGPPRRRDLLLLVDPGQGQVEIELDAFRAVAGGAGRFDRQLRRDPAHDVVVADVDVGVGGPDRVADLLLGFADFGAGRQRPGGSELGAAGRVFGQLDQGVDRAGDVEVAADLGRARPAHVGAAVFAEVVDEVADLQLPGGFLASGGTGRFALRSALPLRFFERRFDEAEGRRVDFVLDAFVVDVGAVGQQDQAAVEIDLFAADRAADLRRHVELGQLFGPFALERAREADVDVAAFLARRADPEREVELAAFDSLQGGVVDDRLRVSAAAVSVAAGGERGRDCE